MEAMRSRMLGRYLGASLALNVVFAAMGLLFRHPAGAPGWWVTWIAADVAVVSAAAMAVAGRPLRLNWDRMSAWVFICVNAGAVVALVVVAVAAWRCDLGGAPDACLVSLDLALIPLALIVVDFVLGAIWVIGRAVGRAIRAA